MDKGLTKNEIITLLTRSEHSGKKVSVLSAYSPTVKKAAVEEAEFLAHLIAYNDKHGSIRDSKIALPMCSLTVWESGEFADNSLAHLTKLDPISMTRAIYFSKEIRPFKSKRLVRLVEAYLREREKSRKWWDATVLQHRKSMKTLYALCHIKPAARANRILFENNYKAGEVFATVKRLKDMTNEDAASAILNENIPFQIAIGALGAKAKDSNVVLALIEKMTPNQLVNNAKMLERLGVKTDPVLRSAYESGLQRVAAAPKANVFKTTRAAEAVSGPLKEKLKAAQEKQIESMGKVKGRWLVLGDRSGSMANCIEASREIASTLARVAEDDVWLVFFDTSPAKVINARGKTYDEILKETKNVNANGGTSIGCGLQYILDKGIEVDGIAIASDGAEHSPPYFVSVYTQYCKKFDKGVPVYFYDLPGEPNYNLVNSMKQAGFDMQIFDMRGKTDYYALPNLIQTMSVQRYGLVDKIMETPLVHVRDVIKSWEEII